MTDTLLATFWADGMWFGLDVSRVQEVLRDQSIEPVPRAPSGVMGLVNLRGQVIAAIDLRVRLGSETTPRPATPVHYICLSPGVLESLVVDHEGDVIDVAATELGEVPETTPASIAALLRGAVMCHDELLLVLDLDRVLRTGDGDGGRW